MVCSRISTLAAVVITIAVATSGCGFTQTAPVADSGTVTVSLSDGSAKPGGGESSLESATITGITLEISASDMDTINTTIPTGTLETSVDVPAGENRTFAVIVTIAGYDFPGSATGVDIAAGSSTTVTIDITIDGTAYAIYTVGGSVSGLSGSLTLQLNGANNLSVSSSGSFAFSSAYFMTSDAYSVTILTQPSGQLCSLSNNSGTISGANVTNVTVTCADTTAPSPSAIVGGGDYNLLAKSDGTVWGWGSNGSGQLGDGTTTNSSTPVQVKDPSDSTGFISNVNGVAAGWSHSLALKSGGTVWTWGSNWSGSLGDGTTTNSLTPVQVCDADEMDPCSAFLTNVAIIRAAYDSSLAVKSDGTVWGWGRNWNGRLGDGTSTDSSVPVQVCDAGETAGCTNFLTNVIDAAAGGAFRLALKSDGTVWGWGSNGNGQLGDGTNTQRLTPVQVTDPSDASGFLTGVVALAAGDYHSIALKSDGTVWAWGDNYSGRLGDGTTIDRYTPVQVCAAGETDPCSTFLTGVTAIAASGNESEQTLAIKSDGSLWTWGGNWRGQLGDGTTTDSSVPVQVCASGETDPCSTFLTGVTAITSGYAHSVAVKSDGTIWGWGDNGYGQLGDGTTNDSTVPLQTIGLVTYTVGGTVSGLSGLIGTLVLQNNNADNLTIIADGSFTFASAIANGSAYSVTVLTNPTGQTCSVTNGSGTISGANVTNVDVNCVASSSKSWGTPTLVENSSNVVSLGSSYVATGSGGDTFAVWAQQDSGGNLSIFANNKTSSGSWDASATEIYSGSDPVYTDPRVSVDSSGNGMGIWTTYGTISMVWVNFYLSGAEAAVSNLSYDANFGSGALFDDGNYIVIYRQSDGLGNTTVTEKHTVSGSLQTATAIGSTSTTVKSHLKIAASSDGTAIAVWKEDSDIMGSVYDGSSWGTAGVIESITNSVSLWEPHLAMDSSGNGVVVWYQSSSSNFYLNRYISGSGWQGEQLISDTNEGTTGHGMVEIDGSGTAIAVWQQISSGYNETWANHITVSSGAASGPVIISTVTNGGTVAPRLAIDSSGNAMSVWYQYAGSGSTYNIWANSYTAGGSWGTAELIETDDGTAYTPWVSADPTTGNFTAVWTQWDGSATNVYSNIYQ